MRRLAAAVALCAVLVTVGTVSTIQPAAGVTALGSTLVIKRDVRYGSVGTMPLRLDVYAPLSGTQRPVVVLLHGGEWIRGDKRDLEPEARRIAAMGWVAVSVNYRLTGTRWTGEYDDVMQSLRWIVSSASTLGIDVHRMMILGTSSGGHLGALVATRGHGVVTPTVKVRVVAAWSPPLDLTAPPGAVRGTVIPIDIVRQFIGCPESTCDARYRDASPLLDVGGSTIPMYIANSANEIVPVTPARLLAAALRHFGIDNRLHVLPGSVHGIAADCSVTPCARGYEALVWDETFTFLRAEIAKAAPLSTRTTASAAVQLAAPASRAPAAPVAATAPIAAHDHSFPAARLIGALLATLLLVGAALSGARLSRRRARARAGAA